MSNVNMGSAKADERLADERDAQEIQSYWRKRSDTYSELNIEEMNDWKKLVWREQILQNYFDGSEGKEKEKALDILDIGTGPGFFAINLAQAGHRVTAVDLTQEMLDHARANAAAYGVEISFDQQAGESLPFADNSFDLIVNRNVTWNLKYPLRALKEWKRVLRPGGRMIYFDANWYLYMFDKKIAEDCATDSKELQEKHPAYYEKVMKKYLFQQDWMESIAERLPLANCRRPDWDRIALKEVGMKVIRIEENINEKIYEPEEQVRYRSMPMFMVCAEK